MSLIGLVNPDGCLRKFQRETSQDKSEPLLKPKADRLLLLCAATIPILPLTLCIFFDSNMFDVSGLGLFNHNIYGGGEEVYYVKSYCWSHLKHLSESGEIISLSHYRLFPYILLMLACAIVPAKLSWKLVTTEYLVNVLDYILDAVEESIRDVIEFVIDDTDIDKNVVGSTAASLNSENYRLFADQFYERYLRRRTQLNNSHKFAHFDDIIRVLSHSKYYINIVRCIRLFLLVDLIIVNGCIYWLFLVPQRNPSIFNCPLAPKYQDFSNSTIISVTFAPAVTRTALMWATFILNSILICGCSLTWLIYPKIKSSSVRLLYQLPLADNVEISESYSDLHFILELVHLNRNRLTFVRLAFQILGVVEMTGSDLQESNKAFISVFREATTWSLSDDGKTNSIASKLVNNLEHNPTK